MASEKDFQLVEQLIEATNAGRVPWEPTARVDEFTSSFKGKYGVIVARLDGNYTLRMLDETERELLRLEYDPNVLSYFETPYSKHLDEAIVRLFEHARRAALNTDRAIDDILHALKA